MNVVLNGFKQVIAELHQVIELNDEISLSDNSELTQVQRNVLALRMEDLQFKENQMIEELKYITEGIKALGGKVQ